jgi:myo-inositol-1-phosphate synthase
MKKLKICFIGIKGGISTTLIAGIFKSIQENRRPGGLLTDTALFHGCDLCDMTDFEFGGFDIRGIDLYKSALENDQNNILNIRYNEELRERLEAIPVYKGIITNGGKTISDIADEGFTDDRPQMADMVDEVRSVLREFKGDDDCIVVNVASTERFMKTNKCHSSLERFEQGIRENSSELTPGQLYAYAAFMENIPYINFTPSICCDIPALFELAEKRKVPFAGKDGKTGETLVKTVLADLFFVRNLKVNMWYGTNILGNLDGKILDDSMHKSSKIESKKNVLKSCLGYETDTQVRIDYMKHSGDNKVAWDYIHFSGFCGANMTLTFSWFGIDSFLAAPLVVDLIRLVNLAQKRGEYGIQKQLSVFFKSPVGVQVHSLVRQYDMLKEWVEQK